MATREHRQERRILKQKLFYIRRHVEGEENTPLTEEHVKLKSEYESLSGFTTWSGFPEKWDIGDPNQVKMGSWGNEVDHRNFKRAYGLPYDCIVSKELAGQKPTQMTLGLSE